VVIRKPGKPDYIKIKAYRPIALESALGKVLESIMIEIISYLTETYELLPTQHFGGRPGRSAEDAMMMLSESIYEAWKEQKIFTAIFMDVADAFNNIHYKRLFNNLQKRRIPKVIIGWIQSFLSEHTTQLIFNRTRSANIATPAGVPQGSPLSPLLYMYYNADLLDIAQEHGNAMSLGFIDDIVYGMKGYSDEENVDRLSSILRETES